MSKLPILWACTKTYFSVHSPHIKQITNADAGATLTHNSWAHFFLTVLKPVRCSDSNSIPVWEMWSFSFHTRQQDSDLTWVPVWFWCIRQDGPYGWSWSRRRKGNHRGRWPEPLVQTASCPWQRRCSLDRRGRSGKNRCPSQCWLPEAAGTRRRSPHFLCEGFLTKKTKQVNVKECISSASVAAQHSLQPVTH